MVKKKRIKDWAEGFEFKLTWTRDSGNWIFKEISSRMKISG